MSSAVTSCSSRPLSGVRVFLHIRHGSGDEDGGRRNHSGINTDYAMKRNGDGSRASARDVLRTARFHVQQLGATLALSEAAADLVVFHRGSASFLEAAHVKFKAVVRPDYLAACVAADQRVSIAPYVVSATAATCTTPARLSTGTSSSAVPASHTSAASPGGARRAAAAASDIPHSTGWGAKSSRSTRRGAAAAPSRATRSPPKCGAQTSAPAEDPTNPPLLHRLLLLDDDEDGGKADHQQQQQRGLATLAWVVVASKEGAAAITAASPCCTPSAPRAAPSTPTNSGATKPHHLIAGIPNSETSAIPCAPGQLQSDGAGGQQRRCAARAKRGVHQESTAAFELNEDITQQPSTDTASTPRLTPSSRYEVDGCGSQGMSAMALPSSSGNERVAAAVERWEADTGEEEAIRHAVLRSTATAAVTRRRGRPHKEAISTPRAAYTVSLPAGSAAGDRSSMGKRSRDPFLNSEGSSQQLPPRAAPAPSPSELRGVSVAVTEPLTASSRTASIAAAQPQTPSAASAAPTRTTAKRPRSSSSSSVADSCAEESTHHTRATPSDKPQGSRQRRRKQEDAGHGAVHEEASESLKREQQQQQQRQLCARRRRRISGRGRAEVLSDLECTPAAELPLSMTFTDLAFLRRLASEDEKVGVTAAGLCVLVLLDGLADVDAAAATLSSFLRDVVEQLGATCVVLGGDDDDSGGCSCWFGRRKRAHAERVRRMAKKPTHLVVSPHAVLTPDILFCKALGIPIVTPQWLYDAVALGAFPAVLPHVHAHPVYGDRQVADAAVAVAAPVTAAGVPRRHELLGVEEDDGDAVEAKAVRAGAKARTRCPPRCGGSSTLRQLRKEVAEEYVPAGEQAMRPFYVPIFQDRMFYLHVPPVDLATANAVGGGAGPLRSSRASRNGRSGNYLGDATAALAQVKELLRVLGGTVTRNVGSTYLDLVIDLTGFYDNMVKLGLTAREQQSQQPQQARTLHESLSCAFQDALQRVSLQPVSMDAGPASTASPTAPPVVGIAWLIHSILTRQWTATDPFALTGHPLTVQIATVHPRAQVDGTEAASATVPCEHATGSGAVAAPVAEDALVAAGEPAAMDAPYTHTPSAPPSHEEAAESLSSSVWSAVVAAAAAPHLKHARGPKAALKHASHQLGTQEIAAMLSDAQLQSVGVPDAATPSIPEPAHPPHQSVTAPFCMEEEDSLAFARIQYSDGDFDGVV